MEPKRKYEGLFIFRAEDSAESQSEEEKKLEEAIGRFGGRILQRRDCGRRPLGYSVRKVREGRMLLWDFEIETGRLAELRKVLEQDEKILRSMIVKSPELKPHPEKEKKQIPSKERQRERREAAHGRQP